MNWQEMHTAPKNRKVLVCYQNELGNWRRVIASYYTAGTLELSDDADETDDGYAPEGWYEESETHESIRFTDKPPTHWMPLPTPPAAAPTHGEGESNG